MTRKQKRFAMIAAIGIVLGLAALLVLTALNQSITFFRSPSDVATMQIKPGTRMRLGGLVEAGSIIKSGDAKTRFSVTDGNKSLIVDFIGLLPDIFREGQGVVTEGTILADGTFKADNVLAKHDENYMPREVSDALKKQGTWQGDKAIKPQLDQRSGLNGRAQP